MKVAFRFCAITLLLLFVFMTFASCAAISYDPQDIFSKHSISNFLDEITLEEDLNSEVDMKFTFEAVNDYSLILGTSYLMDFGDDCVGEGAALIEGKMLTVFGEPYSISENEENGFEYIIKATSEAGEATYLAVYSTSGIQIGGDQEELTRVAANALIDYVNAAEPSDFKRVRYYMDFGVEITSVVKDGKVTMKSRFLSDDEIDAVYSRWEEEQNR